MSDQSSTEAVASAGPPPFVCVPLNRRKAAPTYATIDAGDQALVERYLWHQNNDGYAVRTVDPATGQKEPMARLIMGLVPGDGLEADHISRDRLDNRRCNLRIVTHAENSQNRANRGGSSAFRGVAFRKGKKRNPWAAYGRADGKQHHIGFFASEREAADAARAWRAEHMPFARD